MFFTSDNGPWLTEHLNGGSAGLFSGGKFDTWEVTDNACVVLRLFDLTAHQFTLKLPLDGKKTYLCEVAMRYSYARAGSV